MLSSARSNNKPSQEDPFGILPIKGFISHISKRLEELAKQLKQEQELLVTGTADQISIAAQEKLNCMQELSMFVSDYFDDKNAPSNASRNKLEQSLQSINDICLKNKIEEWNNIRELISHCHNLSNENSILLANRLKYTNNAIDTLYSLAGAPQTKTYDNNGLSQQARSSRQLASV